VARYVKLVRLVEITVNPVRDPIVEEALHQLRGVGILNRVGAVENPLLPRTISIPIYLTYEPGLPNPYVALASTSSPNYVLSNELSGLTPNEVALLSRLGMLRNAVTTPIEARVVKAVGKPITLPTPPRRRGATSLYGYEEPLEYFIDVSPGMPAWKGVNRLDFAKIVKPAGVNDYLPIEAVAEIWVKPQGTSSTCRVTVTTYISTFRNTGTAEARLISLGTSSYVVYPGKPNLIVVTTYLTGSRAEQLFRSFKGMLNIEYVVSVENPYSKTLLAVDRVAVLYAGYSSGWLNRAYESAVFKASIVSSGSTEGEVYPNGNTYLVRVKGNSVSLLIGSRISKAQLNLLIPNAIGSSLIWRFKTISIPLRIHLEKGIVPVSVGVKVCIGADGGICSQQVRISGGESKTVTVSVPQPSLTYSLAVQQFIPFTILVTKPKNLAVRLDMTAPHPITIPARIMNNCWGESKYLGYTSLPLLKSALYAPLLSSYALSYVDTAEGTSSLNFTQSYLIIRYAAPKNDIPIVNGASPSYLFSVNVTGASSSLTLRKLDIRISTTGELHGLLECSDTLCHSVSSAIATETFKILTRVSGALRSIGIASPIIGVESVSTTASAAGIPAEAAQLIAAHATLGIAYCISNYRNGTVTEVAGPYVGYLKDVSVRYVVSEGYRQSFTFFTMRFRIKYLLESGSAVVSDNVSNIVRVPFKGISPW